MIAQLKSDMHLEHYNRYTKGIHSAYEDPWYINPKAEVLLLAGDITTWDLMDVLLEKTQHIQIPILYVPGNHEYYGSSMEEGEINIRMALKDTNITYLNRAWHVINDVVFIGATLWTNLQVLNISHLRVGWSDFEWINHNTVNKWHQHHLEDLQFITNALKFDQFRDMKKVVMTHHLPSHRSSPSRFAGSGENCFFYSYNQDCEQIMRSDVSPILWVHGHTHDSVDYQLGNSRVVCNPYGYFPKAINPNFNKSLIIETESYK